MVELGLNVGRVQLWSVVCLVKWFGQLFVIRRICMNKGGFCIIHAILDYDASNAIDYQIIL